MEVLFLDSPWKDIHEDPGSNKDSQKESRKHKATYQATYQSKKYTQGGRAGRFRKVELAPLLF